MNTYSIASLYNKRDIHAVWSPRCSQVRGWQGSLGLACSSLASTVAAAWGPRRVWLNAQDSFNRHTASIIFTLLLISSSKSYVDSLGII